MSYSKQQSARLDSLERKLDLIIATITKQQKLSKLEQFYTYKEASQHLGITVEGLKSRIKRGQMNRVTNNNRPLIAHSELQRFINSQNPK
jgi:hypothetical protein